MTDDKELNYDPDRFLEGPQLPQPKIKQACPHTNVLKRKSGYYVCRDCLDVLEMAPNPAYEKCSPELPTIPGEPIPMNPAYVATEDVQEINLHGQEVLDLLSPELQDRITGCSHIAQVFSAITGEWRCRDCDKLIETYEQT